MAKKKAKSGIVWELTLFLLKPEVATWREALPKEKRARPPRHETVAGLGTLIVKTSKDNEPNWVTRLSQHWSILAGQKQRSPGAVLFITAGKRMFAATFGYGRSLLSPDKIVHDFGIRCVLNSVSSERLRSLDLRTLETDPLSSRKQFGEGKPLASFGVDKYRDLLRGVAGIPRDRSPLMSGADSLHIRLTLESLAKLPAECQRLLRVSIQDRYKTDFAWIDYVRLVRDTSLKAALAQELQDQCSRGASDVDYVVPHIRDAHRLDNMRGSWSKNAETSLTTDEVRLRLEDRAKSKSTPNAFIESLKVDRVGEPSLETGGLTVTWMLFDALVWTVEHNGSKFILNAGDWYELDRDFIEEVENQFDRLTSQKSIVQLPPAVDMAIPGNSYFEQEYNIRAAKAAKLVNLDRKDMMKGLTTVIEPCDLLDSKQGTFVHVKDGRGSNVLSHLFNQGTVALEAFLSVEKVRNNVRKLAKVGRGASALREPLVHSKLTVVFAIVDRAPTTPRWRLPFFSMLAAKNAAERIESKQAKCQIVRIDDQRRTP